MHKDKLIRFFATGAVIIILLTILADVFIIKNNYYKIDNLVLVINLFIILLSLSVLIIKPNWWQILFFLSIFEATPTITSDTPSLGIFLYLFALGLGLLSGLFKKHAKRRLFFSLLPMLLVFIYLFFTVSYGRYTKILIITMIEITMMALLFLLFKQHVEELLPAQFKFDFNTGLLKNEAKKIDLKELGFTFEDAYIINEILQGKLYKEIASKSNYSESSIKRKASSIFEKFTCESRKEFENNAKQFDIVFGDNDVYKKS